MPKARPGDFAQALMDLGATVCTPRAAGLRAVPVDGAVRCAGRRHPGKLSPQGGQGSAAAAPRRGVLADARGVPGAAAPPPGQGPARRHGRAAGHGVAGEHFDESAALADAPAKARWRRLPGSVRHGFTHFELELVVFAAKVAARSPGPRRLLVARAGRPRRRRPADGDEEGRRPRRRLTGSFPRPPDRVRRAMTGTKPGHGAPEFTAAVETSHPKPAVAGFGTRRTRPAVAGFGTQSDGRPSGLPIFDQKSMPHPKPAVAGFGTQSDGRPSGLPISDQKSMPHPKPAVAGFGTQSDGRPSGLPISDQKSMPHPKPAVAGFGPQSDGRPSGLPIFDQKSMPHPKPAVAGFGPQSDGRPSGLPIFDQKSMPPMPPPPGIAGGASFFGSSATIASVVMSRPATDAASCNAVRTTLAGSTMPASSRST